MEKVLEINNLSLADLLNKISFSVEKNTFITISGPNNCGKTSIFRILNKELPYTGKIILNNNPIEEYKIDEYFDLIYILLPGEISFSTYIVEEILSKYLNNKNEKKYNDLIKKLKLDKILKKDYRTLDIKDIIRIQLFIGLLKYKLLLIDDIYKYFDKNESKELETIILKNKTNKTIIMNISDLEYSLNSDKLYILYEGVFMLEGDPKSILEKDNILNKIGLRIPFMIDLSVKLRDYDLVKEIELDMDRMVDTLWK